MLIRDLAFQNSFFNHGFQFTYFWAWFQATDLHNFLSPYRRLKSPHAIFFLDFLQSLDHKIKIG